MNPASEVMALLLSHPFLNTFIQHLEKNPQHKVLAQNTLGSLRALLAVLVFEKTQKTQVYIAEHREAAQYIYDDIKNSSEHKRAFFLDGFDNLFDKTSKDKETEHQRLSVLHALTKEKSPAIIVSYTEAMAPKMVGKEKIKHHGQSIKVGDALDPVFITEYLDSYGFSSLDFVYAPGTFSVRGGIMDVYSYASEHPFRIEFNDTVVESIRSFDLETQHSIQHFDHVNILPNISELKEKEKTTNTSLFDFLDAQKPVYWFENLDAQFARYQHYISESVEDFEKSERLENFDDHMLKPKVLIETIKALNSVYFSQTTLFDLHTQIDFQSQPQPSYVKNFDALHQDLLDFNTQGFSNFIFAYNPKQIERIYTIYEDLEKSVNFKPIYASLSEGFYSEALKLCCFTDHQVFGRYYRYKDKRLYKKGKKAQSIKDLIALQKGDFVVHTSHGVGRFDGLEEIQINGKKQEAIRIYYRDNDLLYVNIHSLHKLSKFSSKEGKVPSLEKLGSKHWALKKAKTKARVKKVAFDLIQLYAKRKQQKGFAFSPDTYLQTELEASFMFEDTPDQLKATALIKKDMESDAPMDRLVCGDVGFGKTELAIRAAFKAVADSKQVVVLAPTTILSLQHYHTFSARLKNFPCTIDYLNRFKSSPQKKETLSKLKEGKIDIIIGTHAVVSKRVEFKDLGLLIVDEEHKFGVSVKDKLKTLKVNIDTLTLTATPIPRTLQFSLMNARDMSIMSTPPVNRQAVETRLTPYNEELIQTAVHREVARGGQVYFIHNRVQNIQEIAGMLSRLCPKVKISVAHGQLKPELLEKKMMQFMEGAYDVLVATTIIESGLDIPNANTILINNAQMFGLSDLHQMRGRVGRSNRKAYCYLITPPLHLVSVDARKRLKVIEQFTEIGSGFQIAMRDLDIRGAGDLLGAEQSGFISDIGYETYQKILNEAIEELKENEFKEVFKDELEQKKTFVTDCALESDHTLLFPSNYINNVRERLYMYDVLSNIKDEKALASFKADVQDRFGPLPKAALDLLDSVRLKWLGKALNFEKLILKKEQLHAYFIKNAEHRFYAQGHFANLVAQLHTHGFKPELVQKKQVLKLVFKNISSVDKALEALRLFKD